MTQTLNGMEKAGVPRPIPRPVVVAVFLAGVIILVMTAFLYPQEGRPQLWLALLSVLAFPLMIAGIDLENVASTRKRAAVYTRLGMALPRHMARGLRWRFGAADGLGATVGGYLALSVLKDYVALPPWVLLSGFVLLMIVPLALGWVVLRRMTQGRFRDYEAVAKEHGLKLQGKPSLQADVVLRGEYGGRQVSLLSRQAQQRLAVQVQETEGEGLRLLPASPRARQASNEHGVLAATGNGEFDERFVLQGFPRGRAQKVFADVGLQATLAGYAELGKLAVELGGDALIIDHDYNHPDAAYIQRLLTVGVQLARRWDGRLFSDER